ncbi:hypothetical protein D3C80_2058810 [compost metagenome]
MAEDQQLTLEFGTFILRAHDRTSGERADCHVLEGIVHIIIKPVGLGVCIIRQDAYNFVAFLMLVFHNIHQKR